MTTPRYEVEDVRRLFNDAEIDRDLDSCASLPFGVWDRVESEYVSRHATREEAEAAIPLTDTSTVRSTP